MHVLFNNLPKREINPYGKCRPLDKPYSVYLSEDAEWEYRVRKWHSHPRKVFPFARVFVSAKTPATFGTWETGDMYVESLQAYNFPQVPVWRHTHSSDVFLTSISDSVHVYDVFFSNRDRERKILYRWGNVENMIYSTIREIGIDLYNPRQIFSVLTEIRRVVLPFYKTYSINPDFSFEEFLDD